MKKLLTLALLLFMLSSHEAFSKTYYFVFDSYVGRSGNIAQPVTLAITQVASESPKVMLKYSDEEKWEEIGQVEIFTSYYTEISFFGKEHTSMMYGSLPIHDPLFKIRFGTSYYDNVYVRIQDALDMNVYALSQSDYKLEFIQFKDPDNYKDFINWVKKLNNVKKKNR